MLSLVLGLSILGWLFVLFQGHDGHLSDDFDIRFGIISKDAEGCFELAVETDLIPRYLQPSGFYFGYAVEPSQKREYTTSEVIYLPAPPARIDFDMPIETKDGGRVIRTSEIIRDSDVIYPFCFSRGDPLGLWRLEIFIDGRLRRSFRFEVVEPKNSGRGMTSRRG